VIQIAIANESGGFSMQRPNWALGKDGSKPRRPIGVISPKALKGEPHPLWCYGISTLKC